MPLLLHRIGNLLAYVAALLVAKFLDFKHPWRSGYRVREPQICSVADSNPTRSRVFANYE